MDSDIREAVYEEKKNYERAIRGLKKSELSESNTKTLLKFVDYCLARDLSKARIIAYLARIKKIGILLNKDFKEATKEDMQRVMAEINSKGYSPHTISTIQKQLRCFWRWLYDLEDSESLPASVKWIKSEKPPNTLEKENLLTEEELTTIIKTAESLQWKALISTLYEGSLRPGELLGTKIKDVYVYDTYIKLAVAGKMGKKQGKRDIYLMNSYDLLTSWLDNHPNKENNNSPLWVTKYKKEYYALSQRYLIIKLKRLAKEAGIKKRVYPYLFRHSKGTQMYIKYGEAIAKKFMGHSKDSKMASVYNHLNDEDVLKALLGKEEIKKKEVDKRCARCKHFNSFEATRCSKCGLSLDIREAKPMMDEEMVKQLILNTLGSLGLDVKNLEKV